MKFKEAAEKVILNQLEENRKLKNAITASLDQLDQLGLDTDFPIDSGDMLEVLNAVMNILQNWDELYLEPINPEESLDEYYSRKQKLEEGLKQKINQVPATDCTTCGLPLLGRSCCSQCKKSMAADSILAQLEAGETVFIKS